MENITDSLSLSSFLSFSVCKNGQPLICNDISLSRVSAAAVLGGGCALLPRSVERNFVRMPSVRYCSRSKPHECARELYFDSRAAERAMSGGGEEVRSGEGGGEVVRSEDELGLKWDRCVADTIIKTGTGIGLGLVFSLVLFKRRPWPVTLGLGYGLGYSMANCQHDFSRLPSPYLRPSPAQTTPTSGAEGSGGEAPPTDSTPQGSGGEAPPTDSTP